MPQEQQLPLGISEAEFQALERLVARPEWDKYQQLLERLRYRVADQLLRQQDFDEWQYLRGVYDAHTHVAGLATDLIETVRSERERSKRDDDARRFANASRFYGSRYWRPEYGAVAPASGSGSSGVGSGQDS